MPFKISTTNHSLAGSPFQKGHHDQKGMGRDKTPVVSQTVLGKGIREIWKNKQTKKKTSKQMIKTYPSRVWPSLTTSVFQVFISS